MMSVFRLASPEYVYTAYSIPDTRTVSTSVPGAFGCSLTYIPSPAEPSLSTANENDSGVVDEATALAPVDTMASGQTELPRSLWLPCSNLKFWSDISESSGLK